MWHIRSNPINVKRLHTQRIDVHLAPQVWVSGSNLFLGDGKTFTEQPGLIEKRTLVTGVSFPKRAQSRQHQHSCSVGRTSQQWQVHHHFPEVRAGARSVVASAARCRSLAALSSRSRSSSSVYSGSNKYGCPSNSNGSPSKSSLFHLFSAILSQ